MTLSPVYSDAAVQVFHADHAALAEHLREAGVTPDALICDPPYSPRTHAGHNGVVEGVNGAAHAFDRRTIGYDAFDRRTIGYFVSAWSPLVAGWLAILTDDESIVGWRDEMESSGRRAFQSLPCCISGMTVRLTGDGPSSEAVHAVVSRPRSKEMATWGTRRGFYSGPSEPCPWIGGKPVWLIRAIVRDYSRPAALIVDPCCGAGTLGVAVRYEGRRAILADRDPAAVETTIKRLRGERTKPVRDDIPGDLFRGLGAGPEDFRGSDDPSVPNDIREIA